MTLACPADMKVAGLQDPEQRFPLGYGLSKGTIIGFSTRARIDFGRAILARSYDATVGVLCRRPDASGSIVDNPRLPRRGERPGRVCARTEYLYRSPGRLFVRSSVASRSRSSAAAPPVAGRGSSPMPGMQAG